MKRIILMLAAMLFLTCGCHNQTAAPIETNGLKIITTIFPLYDFARQVAGENAEVTMLLPPGAESHSYEPTPQDIINIQNCDIFLIIGGASDSWAQTILDSVNTENMTVLTFMDRISLLEEEVTEGMYIPSGGMHDDHDGHSGEAPEYDEHIWTSPQNAILMVEHIEEALIARDPSHSSSYAANAAAYAEALQGLDADFRQVVAGANRHTLLFGDRFPFLYFARAYGLSYFAAYPGCAEEAEPSAATVAFLIEKTRAERIPVVLYIELSNERMADTICEATGAKKLLLHSCHNVSKTEFDAGISYLELMRNNVSVLKEALS